ncbi:MAG: hypothetical protein HQL20_09650, partial [Candidatus Omnitrophica bacterium]|nr:hypothetical protein [Candidatus Omnitrophota bacterium]
MDKDKKLVVFEDKKIRRILHEGEWFFSVVDVVGALTDSPNPRQYWRKIKDREFDALECVFRSTSLTHSDEPRSP